MGNEGEAARGVVVNRGFTMVELVVVIGVVMVLLGFLLPALSGARGAAELTREGSLMRQYGLLVETYLAGNDGVYPTVEGSVAEAQVAVPELLSSQELLREMPSAVIDGVEARAQPLHSMCFHYDWKWMEPGHTRNAPVPGIDHYALDLTQLSASKIRAVHVTSPSKKGLAHQDYVLSGAAQGPYCCVFPAPDGPVVFADGSVENLRWTEMVRGGALVKENGIGTPVFSTWSGVRGFDR